MSCLIIYWYYEVSTPAITENGKVFMPKVEVNKGYRDAVIDKEPEIAVPVSSKTPHTSLSLLVFYVTCNDISVIYVTAQMCRRTEEVVPTVGLQTP